MDKLELKHLAPYLPYKLKIDYGHDRTTRRRKSDYEFPLSGNNISRVINDGFWKPILRPLSDLTKEIEVNGENIIPVGYIFEYCAEYHSRHGKSRLFDNEANTQCVIEWIKPKSLSYSSFEILLEWHFDVFGLIPQGLAIDINALNKQNENN